MTGSTLDTTGLELVRSTRGGAALAGRGLALCRFWRETSLEEVAILREAFAIATRRSDDLAFVVVIDEDTDVPKKQVRDGLSAIVRDHAAHLRYWAACVRGRGVTASSKRTFMRLLMSFGDLRCPWTVAPDPNETIAWLVEQAGSRDAVHDQARLLAAIDGARPTD